jgi:hypothetical protein
MSTPESVLYAGYGANRDPAMIEAIIGEAPNLLTNSRLILQNVELCVQRVDQTPDVVVPGAPAPLSIREILEDPGNWGPNSGFETYTIRRKQGGLVLASLFKLTQEQRALVAEWEMIPYGWYEEMSVIGNVWGVTLGADTEGLRQGQEIDRVVDGINYETYLIDPAKMHEVAVKTRKEYYERQTQE